AGLTVVGHHLNAGDSALDELVRVVDDAFVGFVGLDLGDGSGDCFASLAAVAGDDDFTQGRCDGDHGEIHFAGAAAVDGRRFFLGGESDAGDSDALRAGGHALQEVAPVDAGECADLGADDVDGRVGDRLLRCGIDYTARNAARALCAEVST